MPEGPLFVTLGDVRAVDLTVGTLVHRKDNGPREHRSVGMSTEVLRSAAVVRWQPARRSVGAILTQTSLQELCPFHIGQGHEGGWTAAEETSLAAGANPRLNVRRRAEFSGTSTVEERSPSRPRTKARREARGLGGWVGLLLLYLIQFC